MEIEGVAQIFYDRIEARCKGVRIVRVFFKCEFMESAGRVVGLFQKPANLEDAKTPENK